MNCLLPEPKVNTKLKALRVEKGLKQSDLAKLMDVAASTIAMIESGKRVPSLELAFKIAKFYGKKIEEIF